MTLMGQWGNEAMRQWETEHRALIAPLPHCLTASFLVSLIASLMWVSLAVAQPRGPMSVPPGPRGR